VERLLRNRGNLLTADADVANGIQPRLRIHHPPAMQHDIVRLRDKHQGNHEKKSNAKHASDYTKHMVAD
jgi:hypothetical protein